MRPVTLFALLATLCAALLSPAPWAQTPAPDLVLIVHPASGVRQLDRQEAANIFMGRLRRLPSGLPAMPIDLGEASPERRQFYRWLLKKDLAEIDAYWARLIFSGQTAPPLRVKDPRTAVDLVAANRNAVAYVPRRLVDARVRVALDPRAQTSSSKQAE